MRKAFLSLSVIISFIIYALYERFGGTINEVAYQAPDVTNQTTLPVKPVTVRPSQPVAVMRPSGSPMGMGRPPMMGTAYRDGTYVGASVDVYYGNVQVKAIVSGGRLSDVLFMDYPKDRSTSLAIANYAMPILKSEAIAAQSANVDGVSGATHTSGGFVESLGGALAQAKI